MISTLPHVHWVHVCIPSIYRIIKATMMLQTYTQHTANHSTFLNDGSWQNFGSLLKFCLNEFASLKVPAYHTYTLTHTLHTDTFLRRRHHRHHYRCQYSVWFCAFERIVKATPRDRR